ncbi:MAG: S9 family peptidase [Brevundimonas sp.]|uniref:alpha/beta hydrolase family protein n=1 Tax=Brevundimonas sp. TaxID=1871086 RepID=UPI00271B5A32|nr:S9 family peptidase [Brevundimonas sp.]MDO9588514.1 S9 family peptidase [Brevundimonas sp.]MDP3656846.1 S9 family peptidase [Brevundimonas sp.]MDZ4110078.1 S9 family peptidase [Brevundimonas sp.]
MSVSIKGAALAVVLLFVTAAAASAQVVPLEVYGALPALEMVEPSPDGDRVALVTVAGADRALVVIDLRSLQLLGRIEVGLAKVRDLTWIGDDDLLITTTTTQSLWGDGGPRGELALGQIYDIERRRLVSVLNNAPGVAPILAGPAFVRDTPGGPAAFVRAYSFRDRHLNLYRLDSKTGRGREAATLDRNVNGVVLDAAGGLVARSTYDETNGRWALSFSGGRAGGEVWTTTALLDPPTLRGLGRDGRSVVVSAPVVDGDEARDAADEDILFEVDPAGLRTPLPFGKRPTFLLFHPARRVLIGGGFVRDTGVTYEFFDPAAAEAWAEASRAFSDRRPRLVSWSSDLQTVLIWTEGPGDAGSYHVVDLERRAMNTLGQTYPAVPADQVAPVRPIAYAAGDGLEIHGFLTTPPGVTEPRGLPLLVLAHGGPASRDTMGFDWWAQALASRGYAVLQANFRGSTGYGQAFLEAGYGEWGRKMQTDLSDGVRWLAEQDLIDPEKVCIVGASYGGYAALAGPTLDPGVYRCAVSVAGVSDLRRLVEAEARQGRRRNTESVRYWNRFMGADGPGDRSLDARSPARLAALADAPILLIHGRDDTVVPIEQSRLMARALRTAGKPVELIELDGEDHWLSRAATRQRMLAETVRFLEQHNPPR